MCWGTCCWGRYHSTSATHHNQLASDGIWHNQHKQPITDAKQTSQLVQLSIPQVPFLPLHCCLCSGQCSR